MTYLIANQIIGSQRLTDNEVTQRHILGTTVRATDLIRGEGEFIYLKGVASTVVGSLVIYNSDDFTTGRATANDKGSMAVAMSANVADEYGWYQIRGKASVRALSGFADDADCYLTSTAGSMDDAVVSGDIIYGMKGAGAVANDVADCEIDLPYTLDGDVVDGTAITATGAEINVLAGMTATTGELNNAADVSARTEELTVSGAVTAGVQSLELNHTGTIIAATIANANTHQGLFIVKDTSATGTIAHTLTLTAGTFNGTNTIATFNLRDEALVIYFDSTGRGTVVLNLGSVALSGP